MKRSKRKLKLKYTAIFLSSASLTAYLIFMVFVISEQPPFITLTIIGLAGVFLGIFREIKKDCSKVDAENNKTSICAKKTMLIKYFVYFFLSAILITYVIILLILSKDYTIWDLSLTALSLAVFAWFIIKEIIKDFFKKDIERSGL